MSHESHSDIVFRKDVYVVQVVMVGEMSVGKTCLVKKFVDPSFDADNVNATIGSDFFQKKFTLNKKNIHLTVFDTAGMEEFQFLPRSYFHGAHAVMLDVWMKDIEQYAREGVVKLVVGNKAYGTDPRTVHRNEGREYAEDREVMFIETSATMGIAVEDAFENLVNGALKVQEFWDPPIKTVNLSVPEEEPAPDCCRT